MDKQIAPKEQQYDVKIETLVPAILTFRVVGVSAEEAIAKTKNARPINVQYRLNGRRDKKATVYDAYMSIVRLVKNLVG